MLALALLLAWAWDACFAEPPDRWHPVAWLGRVLGAIGRRIVAWPPRAALAGGALAWLLLAAGIALAAAALQAGAERLPPWVGLPLLVLALRPAFAWRMLHDEVAAVHAALQAVPAQGMAPARAQLSRLCSRDVQQLDEDEVRETAIETLAENLNDSLLAPLFWLLVAGLPGALVYRMANTADAMWGYRGRWEWAGKWAARADDALSWLPARLAGLMLVAPRFWPRLPAVAAVTPSPNGGWPMGAMALHLGIRLRKPGVYALNPEAPSPPATALPAALRHANRVAWAAALAAALLLAPQAAWP